MAKKNKKRKRKYQTLESGYKGDFNRYNRRNMFFRNEKRKELISKYSSKRKLLKEKGDYLALDKLPKNSCPTRERKACFITGRTRGYMGRFGLCQAKFRELAHNGDIVGIKKV